MEPTVNNAPVQVLVNNSEAMNTMEAYASLCAGYFVEDEFGSVYHVKDGLLHEWYESSKRWHFATRMDTDSDVFSIVENPEPQGPEPIPNVKHTPGTDHLQLVLDTLNVLIDSENQRRMAA